MSRRRFYIFAVYALGLGLFLGPQTAAAQVHAEPNVSGIEDRTCLVVTSGQCLLRTEHRSIEMLMKPDKSMVLILKGQNIGPEVTDSVVILMPIQDDLLERVGKSEMTADEATWVASDLSDFDGTLYSIPEIKTLKTDLGFPPESGFAPEDLKELVRAHLQISLGVGAVTASYLVERMGVEVVEREIIDIGPKETDPLVLQAADKPSLSDSVGIAPIDQFNGSTEPTSIHN